MPPGMIFLRRDALGGLGKDPEVSSDQKASVDDAGRVGPRLHIPCT